MTLKNKTFSSYFAEPNNWIITNYTGSFEKKTDMIGDFYQLYLKLWTTATHVILKGLYDMQSCKI